MDNYNEGRCNERVTRGVCPQQATTNPKTGNQDKCYYHDKKRDGLSEAPEDIVIYEEDEL